MYTIAGEGDERGSCLMLDILSGPRCMFDTYSQSRRRRWPSEYRCHCSRQRSRNCSHSCFRSPSCSRILSFGNPRLRRRRSRFRELGSLHTLRQQKGIFHSGTTEFMLLGVPSFPQSFGIHLQSEHDVSTVPQVDVSVQMLVALSKERYWQPVVEFWQLALHSQMSSTMNTSTTVPWHWPG